MPMAFLTTGEAQPYRPARPCPVVQGPHAGLPEKGAFLVADAGTLDGTSVRIALWRCQFCGTVLVGIGSTEPELDGPPGTGAQVQEFTWLEGPAVTLAGEGSAALHAARP